MLTQIIIDDFATIERLSFDVGPHLNILTGETGAGKSVLVQAIDTALGGRADISMVRTGSQKSVIQIAGEKDGEDVVIKREIFASGKSTAKINGELVSLAQLKDFCRAFIDIHGQYDNQRIMDPDNHIAICDDFRRDTIGPVLEKMRSFYEAYSDALRDLNALLLREKEAQSKQDFYRFEAEYIDNAGLRAGEEEELRADLQMMKNAEKIFSAVAGSYDTLYENEPSVVSALDSCIAPLDSVSSYSDELREISGGLKDAYYAIEDIAERLRKIKERLDFSPSDIDEASERLSEIEAIKRKYGRSVEEILEYRESLAESLSLIDNFDYEKEKLSAVLDEKKQDMDAAADHLTALRLTVTSHLESSVMKELSDLDFTNSEFSIRLDELPETGPTGKDSIEFLISTNPGEPLKPLAKIASGGEIARIMLAFKHIIGDSDMVETMIFDEIDTGISGKTALVVGKKLREISENRQVICITHLPQIAACGDDNYAITKSIADGKSHTEIEHLDTEAKVSNIAGLISGDPRNPSSLDAARDLIKNAGIR